MAEQELREQIDRVRTSLEYSASNVHGLPLRDDAMVRVSCHLLREAVALLALLPKDEWRTIESAPRDGTAVLISEAGDFMPEIARWHELVGWINEYSGPVSLSPTHWQPLPAPPTLISQQEAEHGV